MNKQWTQFSIAAAASTLLCLTACQKQPNKLSLNDQDAEIAAQMEALENEISQHVAMIDERYDQLQLLADRQGSQKKEKAVKKPTPPPVNPTARTCPTGYGFTTMGEFTYWNAFDDGMTVAFTAETQPNSTYLLRPITIDSEWQPGFRVGIGYNAVYDDWWTDLNYTYFRSRNHIHRNLSNIGAFFVELVQPELYNGDTINTNSFGLHWKLGVDLLDLELGRTFFVSNYLSLSPFVSARGAWIRRNIKADSNGIAHIEVQQGTIDQSWTNDMKMKQTTWAVGPRIGVNTRWLFGRSGFAFFMNTDGALMYSGITLHDTQHRTSVDVSNGTQHITALAKKALNRVMPNISLFAGLDYEHCWSDDDFALHVYAGYSLTYFWNQEYFYLPSNINPQGNLGLQGLNTGLKFEW